MITPRELTKLVLDFKANKAAEFEKALPVIMELHSKLIELDAKNGRTTYDIDDLYNMVGNENFPELTNEISNMNHNYRRLVAQEFKNLGFTVDRYRVMFLSNTEQGE